MDIFEITVGNNPPTFRSALTRSKARYAAWLDFSDTNDCSFREYQSFTKVRKGGKPPKDGYDYIRGYYKIDIQIGQRVRLKNEGTTSGEEGEVTYPGHSSQYVHIKLDDEDWISRVHPLSVDILQPPTSQ